MLELLLSHNIDPNFKDNWQ